MALYERNYIQPIHNLDYKEAVCTASHIQPYRFPYRHFPIFSILYVRWFLIPCCLVFWVNGNTTSSSSLNEWSNSEADYVFWFHEDFHGSAYVLKFQLQRSMSVGDRCQFCLLAVLQHDHSFSSYFGCMLMSVFPNLSFKYFSFSCSSSFNFCSCFTFLLSSCMSFSLSSFFHAFFIFILHFSLLLFPSLIDVILFHTLQWSWKALLHFSRPSSAM